MQRYVYVDVKFEKNDMVLITRRLLNNSFFIFIGGLLGSVFGTLGIIGELMSFVEDTVGKIDQKIKSKKKVTRIIQSRQKNNFSNDSEDTEAK